jgi:tetratricopeptide (TPR) repeat protein
VFASLILAAQRQVLVWQNTETLFSSRGGSYEEQLHCAKQSGFYYADSGESDLAERVFRTSLAVNPGSAAAWNKLGSVLINQGRYQEAEMNCQAALDINPEWRKHTRRWDWLLLSKAKPTKHWSVIPRHSGENPICARRIIISANTLAHQGRFDLAGSIIRQHCAPIPAQQIRITIWLLSSDANKGWMRQSFILKVPCVCGPVFGRPTTAWVKSCLSKTRFEEAAA